MDAKISHANNWDRCKYVYFDHKMQSMIGIIVLVVSDCKSQVFQCKLNPIMKMVIIVVENGKSFVHTKHEVKPW